MVEGETHEQRMERYMGYVRDGVPTKIVNGDLVPIDAIEPDTPPELEQQLDKARADVGLPPSFKQVKMSERRQVLVSITPEAHEWLRRTAFELGYVYNGSGNLSAMFEAIGQGKLVVKSNN